MIESINVPKKNDSDIGVYFDVSGYWFYVASTNIWNLIKEFFDQINENIDKMEMMKNEILSLFSKR